jgi:pimeloyl-ACP methyl ester carboxylesterase
VKQYCLSGLGVDKRAFKFIEPNGINLIHIEWIEPLSHETLKEYALRLFKVVNPEDDYNLIGVSFGGMIATEFSKIKQPKNLFLLSTIGSANELSKLFKFGSTLRLHKLIPGQILTRGNFISNYLFGVKNASEKKLLNQILSDTDPNFIKWAINAIVNWENSQKPKAIRIHGNNDKILPLRQNTDYVIEGGGHFMVISRAKEITEIIERECV